LTDNAIKLLKFSDISEVQIVEKDKSPRHGWAKKSNQKSIDFGLTYRVLKLSRFLHFQKEKQLEYENQTLKDKMQLLEESEVSH